MKKFLLGLIFAFCLFVPSIQADELDKEKIKVYVFSKTGCPYCESAKSFLTSIEEEYGKYFDVVEYLVYDANWNADEYYLNLMETVADEVGETVEGVPYIVIGEKTFPGYVADFDEDIKKAITDAYNDENYKDLVAEVENDIANEEEKPSYDGWIVAGIFIVILGGCGALVAFSRKK